MGIQITPSMLAADFANLEAEAARIAGADWLHVDVMDNHFVPNLTIGLPVVEALSKVARQPIDAHLMITEPDRWAPGYVEAGAQSVTFHVEAAQAPVRLAREIRAKGARASMALRPATPIEPYEDLLPELDMVLLMTVEPGFGGQAFLDVCLPKIRRTRELLDKRRTLGVGATSGCRSTAASRPRRSTAAPRREPTCSWPAPPCSAPTTRTPWSPSCAHGRSSIHPPGDQLVECPLTSNMLACSGVGEIPSRRS